MAWARCLAMACHAASHRAKLASHRLFLPTDSQDMTRKPGKPSLRWLASVYHIPFLYASFTVRHTLHT
jgi:hypothetical protein